jgi:hypothetical protein
MPAVKGYRVVCSFRTAACPMKSEVTSLSAGGLD